MTTKELARRLEGAKTAIEYFSQIFRYVKLDMRHDVLLEEGVVRKAMFWGREGFGERFAKEILQNPRSHDAFSGMEDLRIVYTEIPLDLAREFLSLNPSMAVLWASEDHRDDAQSGRKPDRWHTPFENCAGIILRPKTPQDQSRLRGCDAAHQQPASDKSKHSAGTALGPRAVESRSGEVAGDEVFRGANRLREFFSRQGSTASEGSMPLLGKIDVIGVHAVKGPEPCHLVELVATGFAPPFNLEGIVQPREGVMSALWQAPWAPSVLNETGKKVIGDGEEAVRAAAGSHIRLVFFLHYLDLGSHLDSRYGAISLPKATPRPRRLSIIKYEPPLK